MNAYQLELYEPCGVCSGLIAYDQVDSHRACGVALDRWWTDEYIDQLIELRKGQAQ